MRDAESSQCRLKLELRLAVSGLNQWLELGPETDSSQSSCVKTAARCTPSAQLQLVT